MEQKIRPYRFIYDEEPSDEDLKIIMHEVAIEAKRKAEKAERELREKITQQIKETLGK